MTESLSAISIKKLSKSYGQTEIIRDLNLDIESKTFVSIKGPSGCGKTTLLRIIAGLTEPERGEVYIHQKLANNPKFILKPHQRGIGFLFQDLALWPHLQGSEQLSFVWQSQVKDNNENGLKDSIDKVCAEIKFSMVLLTKYPHQLSRGEQQRLAIARVLIGKPKILFLDEPFTALDYNLRKNLIQLLNKIKEKHTTTALIVSHDLMLNSINCDQNHLLQDGQLISIS